MGGGGCHHKVTLHDQGWRGGLDTPKNMTSFMNSPILASDVYSVC